MKQPKKITLKPIKGSSMAKQAGYDPKTQTLAVQFHSGAIHHYSGIDEDTHAALMAADSFGKHFNEHIKPQYESKKIA